MSVSNTNSSRKPANLNRQLALVVIVMGIVLVAGMGVLLVKILGGFDSDSKKNAAGCEMQYYSLNAGETANVMNVINGVATLAVSSPDGQHSLRSINLCYGTIVSELKFIATAGGSPVVGAESSNTAPVTEKNEADAKPATKQKKKP